ncbi:MAG: 1-deoxy-D-xylulose-5-phosphate reductoisomerase [Erysipelotrichaceae bacterium]
MKNIILLGASGSIGQNTLDVIKSYPDKFSLIGASVYNNPQVIDQLVTFSSLKYLWLKSEDRDFYENKYPYLTFFSDEQGLIDIVSVNDYNLLVNALVGFVGMLPTIYAIKNKKNVALANKESLVVGGSIINRLLKENNVNLYPIDSEHSAIWQSLQGNDIKQVDKLIITASGGSFRDLSREQLEEVTIEEALAHPNWSMGAKITIDSATMMNKTFEIIEAHHLFHFDGDHIDVTIHPQSVIHSMVQYVDGSIIAQMGSCDMRLSIQYALTYPDRFEIKNQKPFSLIDMTFSPLSIDQFPFVKLAYDVIKRQGNLGCILNCADEVCVEAFLNNEISFLDIEKYVMMAYNNIPYQAEVDVNDLIKCNQMTKEYVLRKIRGN